MEVYSVAVGGSGNELTSVFLETDLPPTLNQSYSSYPAGGRCAIVMSDAASSYKHYITAEVRSAVNVADMFPDPKASYSVEIEQRLTANSRDADANVKLVIDAVFQGMGVNDNRVFLIILRKTVAKGTDPRLVVQVRTMP